MSGRYRGEKPPVRDVIRAASLHDAGRLFVLVLAVAVAGVAVVADEVVVGLLLIAAAALGMAAMFGAFVLFLEHLKRI